MSLLEQAKAVKVDGTKRTLQRSDEEIELTIAYARGEVSQRQVATALNLKSQGAVGSYALRTLFQAIREGKLVEKK